MLFLAVRVRTTSSETQVRPPQSFLLLWMNLNGKVRDETSTPAISDSSAYEHLNHGTGQCYLRAKTTRAPADTARASPRGNKPDSAGPGLPGCAEHLERTKHVQWFLRR